MVKKEAWRQNLQEFELLSRKVNVITLNGAASFAHEKKKVELALEIWKNGQHFLTDAKLTMGRGFCDLVNLDEPVIHEVMATETQSSIEEKKKRYPFPIEVSKA